MLTQMYELKYYWCSEKFVKTFYIFQSSIVIFTFKRKHRRINLEGEHLKNRQVFWSQRRIYNLYERI